jgi:hypothetical protein
LEQAAKQREVKKMTHTNKSVMVLGFQTHQDFVECMNPCFHLDSVVVKIHEEVLEDWFTKKKETIGMDISIFLKEEEKMQGVTERAGKACS